MYSDLLKVIYKNREGVNTNKHFGIVFVRNLDSQPWELTAKNSSVHCGLSIKPYEMPKKGEGGRIYEIVYKLQTLLEAKPYPKQ